MGELETLGLVLVVVYASECLVWVPRGASVFARWWSRCFRWRVGGTLAGNPHGSLFLANPLPPLGTVFLNHHWPWSVSTEAALGYTAACLDPAGRPPHTGQFVRLGAIARVVANGKKVEVNQTVLFRACSTMAARRWAAWLNSLRSMKTGERAAAIQRALDQSCDTEGVATRVRAFRERTGHLRVLGQLLFGYLFGVAPALVWWFGLRSVVWMLLAGLFAQTLPIAWLARRAHQALYSEAVEERFKLFLTLLLTPLGAIRACDLLGRPLLETVHPLAAARALCAPEEFKRYAQEYLLDLSFPLLPVCPINDPQAAQCEEQFRLQLRQRTEELLAQCGLKPADLMAPPQPSEPANQAYCPRCGAQYGAGAVVCPDCGGRALRRFGNC